MTLSYIGNGSYCYANSLFMSLLGAGATSREVPEPGFLECLTTMPFGNTYVRREGEPMAFFSPPARNPDEGLTLALATLGWTCQEEHGGTPEEAFARLCEATKRTPVLVGPLDMGYLTYNPAHTLLAGEDHFAVVLAVESDLVRLHDPQGYPCASLSAEEFLRAWQAERVNYRQASYTMRSAFRKIEEISRAEMIARTLPLLRENVTADPGGPELYGGVCVFSLLSQDMRERVSDPLAAHLRYFALPLAARRCLDAAMFLHEAGRVEAAEVMEHQACLFGSAQYQAVHEHWTIVADLLERLATLETRLVTVL
jgi:hypothetical protein